MPHRSLVRLTLPVLTLLSAHAVAVEEPARVLQPGAISVFLGAMEVDDQSVRLEGSTLLDEAELDFSTLPGGGIFVEMPFNRGGVETGLEFAAGVAWRNDNTSVAGSAIDGNATVRVDVDNAFLLADLGVGAYARARLGKAASIYLGGGPTAVYGRHEVEDEAIEPAPLEGTTVVLVEDEASDFTIGYYARAGIDFDWQSGYRMGFGARWMSAELEFDDTLGKTDIEGVFWYLSFSQAL